MWDSRSAFDTIIQSSTVDLFHACAVAVAPLARTTIAAKAVAPGRLLGTLPFRSTSMTGSAFLSVPAPVFQAAVGNGPRTPSGTDWVREQTNQLLGRIKKRLSQFQVSLQTGLPAIPTPDRLQRLLVGTPIVYEFRTLRGEVMVVLDATIDYSALLYSGTLNLANEGDIILF